MLFPKRLRINIIKGSIASEIHEMEESCYGLWDVCQSHISIIFFVFCLYFYRGSKELKNYSLYVYKMLCQVATNFEDKVRIEKFLISILNERAAAFICLHFVKPKSQHKSSKLIVLLTSGKCTVHQQMSQLEITSKISYIHSSFNKSLPSKLSLRNIYSRILVS